MTGEFRTSKVFEPITIGTMEVKNRIVAGPMVMNHATEDGHVTPRMVDYYAAKARGGFGLVHVEVSYIRPDGNMFARMLGVYTDRQLSGLNEITEAIHAYGTKCTIQLVHGGAEEEKKAVDVLVIGVRPVKDPRLVKRATVSGLVHVMPLASRRSPSNTICRIERRAKRGLGVSPRTRFTGMTRADGTTHISGANPPQ